ncbi:dual specificity protein phosphatase 19 isoform X2 [Python bivittatus]|uniref:Dual specificity protein phosphatase 19 isoform X2 n=1 Tax=Python bivittatus TaxID=176946 RepID=A0A9F2RDN1_PYTBI|nr:dual specificity protein phosphatase 19 isoform X2 [Python bivittatus]
MHSLTQEIKSFSRTNLKKQCTRVTTLSGKRLIETWRDAQMQVVEVADGSQDAAHDLETMKKYRVTHVLNVAYGVGNAFLHDFTYKTIPILDLPETDITSYFPECFEFIEQIKLKDGVVLVHCNAGVSRAAAIIIGFLMHSEGLNFAKAFSVVKNVRPAICPNSGFMEQLQKYCQCNS